MKSITSIHIGIICVVKCCEYELGILSNIVSNEEHKVRSDSDNLCCDVL